MLFGCDKHNNTGSSIVEKYASIINGVSKVSLDFSQKCKTDASSEKMKLTKERKKKQRHIFPRWY
jgi:hypothetical protein